MPLNIKKIYVFGNVNVRPRSFLVIKCTFFQDYSNILGVVFAIYLRLSVSFLSYIAITCVAVKNVGNSRASFVSHSQHAFRRSIEI